MYQHVFSRDSLLEAKFYRHPVFQRDEIKENKKKIAEYTFSFIKEKYII